MGSIFNAVQCSALPKTAKLWICSNKQPVESLTPTVNQGRPRTLITAAVLPSFPPECLAQRRLADEHADPPVCLRLGSGQGPILVCIPSRSLGPMRRRPAPDILCALWARPHPTALRSEPTAQIHDSSALLSCIREDVVTLVDSHNRVRHTYTPQMTIPNLLFTIFDLYRKAFSGTRNSGGKATSLQDQSGSASFKYMPRGPTSQGRPAGGKKPKDGKATRPPPKTQPAEETKPAAQEPAKGTKPAPAKNSSSKGGR